MILLNNINGPAVGENPLNFAFCFFLASETKLNFKSHTEWLWNKTLIKIKVQIKKIDTM